jgi:hypothetical protein
MPFSRNITEGWEPILPSLGTHFELGDRLKHTEFYVAYRASDSPVRTAQNFAGTFTEYAPGQYVDVFTFEKTETSWNERRFYLGIRRDLSETPSKVMPFCGGAVSLGWSRLREHHFERDRFYFYRENQPALLDTVIEFNYSHSRESHLNPGLAIEFGIQAHTISNVEAMLSTNLQFYLARLPYSGWDLISYQDYYVVAPSVMLQLRYVFR